MTITIEMIDRTYEQIREFCELNNIKVEDYIVQCVEDDFFIRKYGDLNEKFKKEEPKPQPQTETKEMPQELKDLIDETVKVAKKVGRPKKKKEEEPKVDDFIKKPDVVNEMNNVEQKPTKIKRTLKAK